MIIFLLVKLNNITFPENSKKRTSRYSKTSQDVVNEEEAQEKSLVKGSQNKAKYSIRMHSEHRKDSDEEGSYYLDQSSVDKQQFGDIVSVNNAISNKNNQFNSIESIKNR